MAQKVSEMSTISVTGTAEINVVPDEVTFTVKVEKTANMWHMLRFAMR